MKILDEDASESWPGDLGRRATDHELRVALDDLVSLDQRRQVRLGGDIEEDGADPDQEGNHEKLRERQRVGDVGERDRCEQTCPAEIGRDQDRPSRQPVYPDARGQGEEDERQELDCGERGNLERARVQDEDRDERKREQ